MADTQAANIAAVREGIEATNRGDLESVVAGLDPEFVEFHIAPELGNAGTYHGREGYREGFGGWAEAWDDFTSGRRAGRGGAPRRGRRSAVRARPRKEGLAALS
jgi:hypothetical protein